MDLSIGPSAGIAFFLVAFDVWLVNLVKRFLCKMSGKHLGINFDRTPDIPDDAWVIAAVLVPVIICVAFGFDLVASVTGATITQSIPTWMSSIASGVLVGMGAQKTYDVGQGIRSYAQAKGIKVPKSWKPGGENDVSAPKVDVTPPAS